MEAQQACCLWPDVTHPEQSKLNSWASQFMRILWRRELWDTLDRYTILVLLCTTSRGRIPPAWLVPVTRFAWGGYWVSGVDPLEIALTDDRRWGFLQCCHVSHRLKVKWIEFNLNWKGYCIANHRFSTVTLSRLGLKNVVVIHVFTSDSSVILHSACWRWHCLVSLNMYYAFRQKDTLTHSVTCRDSNRYSVQFQVAKKTRVIGGQPGVQLSQIQICFFLTNWPWVPVLCVLVCVFVYKYKTSKRRTLIGVASIIFLYYIINESDSVHVFFFS